MGIVMPGAALGRAASLGEDAGGVVSLERIAKLKVERSKKRLDAEAEEACAWLAYAPPTDRLADAPLAAESFSMSAGPAEAVSSASVFDALPEAGTRAGNPVAAIQLPMAPAIGMTASAEPVLVHGRELSPAAADSATRTDEPALRVPGIVAAAATPGQALAVKAGVQGAMRDPARIASAKPSRQEEPIDRFAVSLPPALPADLLARPLGADKGETKGAARPNPDSISAMAVGKPPQHHRSAQPQPQPDLLHLRANAVKPIGSPHDRAAVAPLEGRKAAGLPPEKIGAVSGVEWQKHDETIAKTERAAGISDGMDLTSAEKHAVRDGQRHSKQSMEAVAQQAAIPANSPAHGAVAGAALGSALAVKAENQPEASLPGALPTDHVASATAAVREAAAVDAIAFASNAAASASPALPGEAGALQVAALNLSGELVAPNLKMLAREVSLIPETRGADIPKAAHPPSRKSGLAFEYELSGAEAGVWMPRPSLSRGNQSEESHAPAAKKTPPQSRQAAVEPEKSPSGMNFRFQSWGEAHAVKITAETGPSGWQLQLQPSDSLVSQRLSEQWASGNPQQWRLLPGDGEGRRDAPPQGETEEDE